MDTHNRFVAMLDIMGASKSMTRAPKAMGNILMKCKKLIQEHRARSNIYITMYSDSITVITKDDDASSFEDLIYATAILERLFIQNQYAINGAISYGKITVDDGADFVFYGKPVVEAHKIQEDLFFYGIVLDCKAVSKMRTYEQTLFCVALSGAYSHPDMLIKMMCPIKSGGWQKMYAINWMDLCVFSENGGFATYGDQIAPIKEMLKQLYEKYVVTKNYGGRANYYLINTELVLREWYEFTSKINQTDGWGTLLADKNLIRIPE